MEEGTEPNPPPEKNNKKKKKEGWKMVQNVKRAKKKVGRKEQGKEGL